MKRRSFLRLLGVVPFVPALTRAAPEKGLTITLNDFAKSVLEPSYKRSANRILPPDEVAKEAMAILSKNLSTTIGETNSLVYRTGRNAG